MLCTNDSDEERDDDDRTDDDYEDDRDSSWNNHPSLTIAQRNPSLR